MRPTHTGNLLNLPSISNTNKQCQICPEQKGPALISIGKLCDDGCIAVADDKKCIIYKEKPIIKALRCPTTGMYVADLTNPLLQKIMVHANLQQFTSIERMKFLHGALGYIPLSTLRRAMSAGYLNSFPDLTPSNVSKLHPSDITILGHLDTKRKNLQSTKVKPDTDEWTQVLHSHIQNKTHEFYHKLVDLKDTIYTDQTGKFRVRSIGGFNYIMITYSYDTNAILVRPLKTRTGNELVATVQSIHHYLALRGYKPKHHIMDNEASIKMKEFLRNEKVIFQLVPPHLHRVNAAERAIRTFKNHLISILCGVHPDFPLFLWCKILPQAEITLNLVRPCRYNPKLSAYEALEGSFSYNRTPLAPLGAKIIAHDTPQQRASWAPHGHYGWLIGPAMEHYRCFTVYNPKTRKSSVVNTFHWSECNRFNCPKITAEEQIATAAKDLAQAIKTKSFLHLPDKHLRSRVEDLCTIFQQTADNIITTKLTPLQQESPPPDLIEHSSKETGTQPRVKIKPTEKAPSISLPVAQDDNPAKSINIPQTKLSSVIPPTYMAQQNQPPTHRYPTRLKIAKAAPSVQLEQSQLTNPEPVTHQFLTDIVNPPSLLKYKELIKTADKAIWERGMCNELGRLAQGYKDVKGRNTIFFISRSQVPKHKKVTYARIVCAIRHQKTETHRVRLTAGGNLISYEGTTSTPTAAITTIKAHWNSVISTKGAKYATLDIKDFYLNSKLKDYEYMKMHISLFPDEFINLYNLKHLIDKDGFIHMEIRGGMYGLPQAGRLAHDELVTHLAPHGYSPVRFTPGLWKHNKRKTTFTLVVDDFGIKHLELDDVLHLKAALETKYTVTVDYSGSLYIGVSLDWNYIDRNVTCSMPGYIPKLLNKLKHIAPSTPQFSPNPSPHITYGAKIQLAKDEDTSPPLDSKGIKLIQSIVGATLYIARILDMTLLVTCNDIGIQQTKSTTNTLNLTSWLLDYMATYPNPSITYKASDMVLWVSSDSSYLSVTGSRSRVGGYHFLGNNPDFTKPLAPQRTFINAPIHVEASILRNVMGAASETEIAGGYVNARMAVELRIMLMEMGHVQPKTPLELDNTTAFGILTKQIIPKRSKAIDMRFFWLRDRTNQNQFHLYWNKGDDNLADYFTKQHPAQHHKKMRKILMASSLVGSITLPFQRARVC